MTQLLDPRVATEVGVVGWCLMAIVGSGVVTIGFFLRRMTQAMDKMAAAQEVAPVILARLEMMLEERTNQISEKLDRNGLLSEEHLRIAKKWESTEAPGRVVREPRVP